MSVAEMKIAILEKVNTLSENQLNELEQFIDKINNNSAEEFDLLPYVVGIVSEREEVMKKLAQ